MLQLLVFNPTDDWDDDRLPASAIRPAEYMRHSPPWVPDLAETLLLLDPAAGASLLPINPFGPLDYLAAQLAGWGMSAWVRDVGTAGSARFSQAAVARLGQAIALAVDGLVHALFEVPACLMGCQAPVRNST